MSRPMFTVDEIDTEKLAKLGLVISGTYQGYVTSLKRTGGDLVIMNTPDFILALTECRKPLGGDDNSGWSNS